MLPLTGYANRLSVTAGESIEFKVSSQGNLPFRARLVRVICGDPNPAGPGIRERALPSLIDGDYLGREKAVPMGSYARIRHNDVFRKLRSFTAAAAIWPTLPGRGEQAIVARYDNQTSTGFSLSLGADGDISARIANGKGARAALVTRKALRARQWYLVWLSYDAKKKRLRAGQAPLFPAHGIDEDANVILNTPADVDHDFESDLLIAAAHQQTPGAHFNGKIERPMLFSRVLKPESLLTFAKGGRRPPGLFALWDFTKGISTQVICDLGPKRLAGELVNAPARAMTGSNWDGSHMCWQHAPEQYGAIHFHEDDLYDCQWQTDFALETSRSMSSGAYAVKLERDDGAYDMIPFIVRPPSGAPRSSICVVIPTFTYQAYGNHASSSVDVHYHARTRLWGARRWTPAEHPDYGLSTYNFHRDGSGIAHASRLRPLLNFRSGYISFVDAHGSGIRHFAADTHLLAWLHERDFDVDLVTDEDVDTEGAELLAPYRVVMTGSHPEYQTANTLDAFTGYTQQGGRLMYLGGNGFYWRVARSDALPGLLEVRRAEGGIRAWAAEPGEYYHALDGKYGGLWRRNGRPPQKLTGVGFSAQGNFEGCAYHRVPTPTSADFDWVFAGVDGLSLGNHGYSGGGAAGFEVDRHDEQLGSAANSVVLASSRGQHDLGPKSRWGVVLEDMLTLDKTVPRQAQAQLIRADMVYTDCPNGGAIFSVGSITYCGSLPSNGFDNDIATVTENVLRRFNQPSSGSAAKR